MTVADLAPVVVPLVVLVVVIGRQLTWRARGTRPVWRAGAILGAVGVVLLAQGTTATQAITTADLLFGLGGLALSALSGALMGRITELRSTVRGLEYRLPAAGLVLWVLFIGIRVGDMLGARSAGAEVAASTAFLLVSLGVNRLVAGLVVEARTQRAKPVVATVG